MHTCKCYYQMCTRVIVQAFSPHLSVVNREMAHVYSVQCTQCIHRNAVYVMLQSLDNVYASRDHSDILHKELIAFPGIFHISHPLIIDTICFYYKRIKCMQVLCPAPVWSLDVEWQECHAHGCTRWAH